MAHFSFFHPALRRSQFLDIGVAVITAFTSQTVDPRHVAIFRVLYALVALSVSLTTFRFLEFKYYGLPAADLAFYYAANVLWFVALACIAAGRFVSVAAFYTCLITPVLFDTTIGAALTRMGAFWLIFLNAGAALSLGSSSLPLSERRVPAWPLYGLAFNIAIVDFFSGVAKLYDPFWVHGTGFYYTLLEPWLRDEGLASWMLRSEEVLLFCNYSAIALQIIGLPLLFFRSTRSHAILSMVAQFALLTYPIRIDPIGPMGLVLCFGMFAIVPDSVPTRLLARLIIDPLTRGLSQIGIYRRSNPESEASARPKRWYDAFEQRLGIGPLASVLAVSAFSLLALSMVLAMANGLARTYIAYPVIQRPLQIVEGSAELIPSADAGAISSYAAAINAVTRTLRDSGIPAAIARMPSWFQRPLHAINEATVGVGWWAPFTMKHFLGRYGYYVHFFAGADPQPMEPLVISRMNGRRGPYESGLLRNTVLQHRSWTISGIAHAVAESSTYKLTEDESRLVRSIFEFSLSRAADQERRKITRGILYVLPYTKPETFDPDTDRLFGDPTDHVALLTYDVRTGEILVASQPPRFTFPLAFPEFGDNPPVVGYW